MRAFIRDKFPFVVMLYRICRAMFIRLCLCTPFFPQAFQAYRRRHATHFWIDVWFAERSTGATMLAEESYWQYYEALGCERPSPALEV